MKKLVSVLTLAILLGCGGAAWASNGTLLDMEEEFVSMFVERGTYRIFEPLIGDKLKPDFNEEVYKQFRKEVDAQCGKMKVFKLRNYEKMDDADVLHYEVIFTKTAKPHIYEFAFDVSTGKPMLVNFELVTLEEQAAK